MKENDFATVVASAAGHLLFPLVNRCYEVYDLQKSFTIRFPSLQEFPQRLAVDSAPSPPPPQQVLIVADHVYEESLWDRLQACQPHSLQGIKAAFYLIISIFSF